MSQGTLAIDLGSSSTLVGWQAAPGLPGEVLALPPLSRSASDPSIPSLVSPSGGGRWLLGQQVIEAGSEADCLRDFKALLGQSNAPASAEQAANALLQGIWQRLPQAIAPQRLVLTAPVQGFSSYRRWLQHWAESLSIDEVALVDEPTAAALGAGLSPGSLVLVLDIGAGTTDLALVRLEGGEGRALPMAQLLRFAGRSASDTSIPSLVSPSGGGRWLLGQQVIEAGSEAECLRDFKALLGQSNAPASAEQAADALLQGIWQRLPQAIAPQRLVLTAPVQGFSGYRRWLQHWAESLSIDEVALVDEPTAAALGAGLSPGSLVLVLDIGAGTTDLALVRLEGGEGRALPMAQLLRFAGRSLPERQGQQQRTAKVLGKAGISVGGRMIDRWWAKALGAPEPAPQAWLNAAEALKCALSEATSAQVVLESEAGPQPLQGSRRELNNVLEAAGLEQLFDGLLNEVEAAARRAGESLDSIDAVMAVGGGSALPWVQQWLQSRLPKTELLVKQPLQAVVLGALAMTPALQVMDVLQHGISLRCWDRRLQSQRWHPLFLPGQAWPTPQPLELVLASRGDQACVEVQLGTPSGESRAEVVFVDGLPVLRSQAAGEASVRPWSQAALQIPLPAGAREGQDCLRLRFGVDAERQLWLEGFDLVGEQQLSRQILGIVE